MRHTSELALPYFNKALLLCRNSLTRAQGLCIYSKAGFDAPRFTKYECSCQKYAVMCVVVVIISTFSVFETSKFR